MSEKTVRLEVPAEAEYARAVRMTAASVAVVCGMSVDDVEDVRMAAEEAFVYACATQPTTCAITFTPSRGLLEMDFSLGEGDPAEAGEDLELARLLLSAISDECELGEGGRVHVAKRAGVANA